MVAVSPSPTTGQTAVRVLFILDRLGEPCADWPQVPDTAVRAIQSQRKLQKLDFLVRNPDYLANLIITRWQDGSLPAERLLDARAVFEEREPELHTYRMLRNDHGAYEALDNALSVLRHLGLIAVRRAGRVSDERVRRRDYFLLQAGADQAQRLRESEEVLAWYDQQTGYVAAAVEGMTGAQLKEQQYGQPEYATTPVRRMIGGISERVRERLDEALAQEGLA
ncbi:hypothetical protein OG906_42365 (plasmid) [Streptomyces sp. NBC_01426]|uniref:hypothetical protein n=1 Tax=Streptomyces TaxID=1883 RepID=UPI00190B9A7F|nr:MULTISPECIES: hypothetical protein [Streptomyces]MBK3627097.1 hypothetical protein [Streptomyces sp. MBT49]QUW85803.1 hypothetical protein SMIR_43060 [Streptomyces mirabilis]